MQHWQAIVTACYGPGWRHPLRHYEEYVISLARPQDLLVDAGCGRDVPLRAVLPRSVRYLGIDRVGGICADLERLPLADGCADLVTSRSTLEHLRSPERVFAELARVLKREGKMVVLTPNFWDPVSLIAWIIPNRLHPPVVRYGEGRAEADTFPTYYRANTERRLRQLCARCGLEIEALEYWGQYPSVLQRWPALFRWGCRAMRLLEEYRGLRKLRGWIFLVARRTEHR